MLPPPNRNSKLRSCAKLTSVDVLPGPGRRGLGVEDLTCLLTQELLTPSRRPLTNLNWSGTHSNSSPFDSQNAQLSLSSSSSFPSSSISARANWGCFETRKSRPGAELGKAGSWCIQYLNTWCIFPNTWCNIPTLGAISQHLLHISQPLVQYPNTWCNIPTYIFKHWVNCPPAPLG